MASVPSTITPPGGFSPPRGNLGTFIGVFTPSILTILGVILFLRIGWVVGSVGLIPALAIVVTITLMPITIGTPSFTSTSTPAPIRFPEHCQPIHQLEEFRQKVLCFLHSLHVGYLCY